MTSSLTRTRHDLAGAILGAVDDATTVTAAPGSNVTAPSVIVLADTVTLATGCLWSALYRLQLVGPGGDNEAGLSALETLAAQVVAAVRLAYPEADLTLNAPTQVTIASSTYLAQDVEATLLVPLEMES